MVEMFADIPALWDVNVTPWEHDSMPSRFGGEGGQEPFTSFVKSVTSKPVVGVGRYTSPDKRGAPINKGVPDLLGGAAPPLCEPFPPGKSGGGRAGAGRERPAPGPGRVSRGGRHVRRVRGDRAFLARGDSFRDFIGLGLRSVGPAEP